MSVRIRPGDSEPVGPSSVDVADVDLDRPRDHDHIRAVFADPDDDADDHDVVDDPGSGFERPTRRGLLSNGLGRPRWSQVVSVTVLAAVGLLVLGGLAYRLSLPADAGSTSQPDLTQPEPGRSPGSPTTTSTGPVAGPDVDRGLTPDAMSAVSWQGAALPVSPIAGPRVFTATRAYGFNRDPLGAALAAVHISTHIDPFTGPRVFTPALRNQVVQARDNMLGSIRTAYETAARARGYDDRVIEAGRPILAPTGAIGSWRIRDYDPSRTTVELLVATPDGHRLVYEIPVVWTAGDWSVSLASADDAQTFAVHEPAGTAGFHRFMTRGN